MPERAPFGFASPYHSPGFLLWRVSGAWQRSVRDALDGLGLTHAQFVFLATLAWHESESEITQAQLAQLIGMDAMTASQLARSLATKGLLRRAPKPGDARALGLEISEQGLETVRVAVPLVEAADARFFASLENSEAFSEALRRLIGVT